MDIRSWQISSATLADGLRPVSFALAVMLSTWVLSDARRRGLSVFAVTVWTLLVLLLTPVLLPLYFIARTFASKSAAVEARHAAKRMKRDFVWPLLYAATLAALGAGYFYLDYKSLDAHLARASQARLSDQHERAIREYRSALVSEDDPHTRKLLGIELLDMGRAAEALAEFRAAESAGEPDELLSFRIASALDALGRTTEAAPAYQKFLQSRACTQTLPDRNCEQAYTRLQQSKS